MYLRSYVDIRDWLHNNIEFENKLDNRSGSVGQFENKLEVYGNDQKDYVASCKQKMHIKTRTIHMQNTMKNVYMSY